jgi:predicted TIM-barrel fold metal-dependent hydrolase
VDYQLISSDSHINEPPDLWTRNAPSHLRDLVPHVVEVQQGDAWVVGPGATPRAVSTSAAAGIKPEDYMKKSVTYAGMRPGSFEPRARLGDMDMDHVDAEVLYPGIARGLDTFHDAEVRRYCARAYNDWLAEFQSTNPQRLIGLAILPPIDDDENAAEELRRAASLGLRGAFLATPVDGRPLSHPNGESLWSAAEELNVPISLHIGAGRALMTKLADPSDAVLPGVREAFLSTVTMSISDHIATLIYGGVFERHPGLKVVIAESGIGWIPYFLERMESVYDRHRHYLHSQLARRPTEVFQKHLFATFQEDHSGLRLRDVLGIDTVMWASDYPHTDTTWPNSLDTVNRYFAEVPPAERHRIVAGNCASLYGLA